MSSYNARKDNARSGRPAVSRADMAAYDTSNYLGRSSGHSHNHKRRNIIIAVVVAVVLVLGCCGFALASSAKELKSQASEVMQDIKGIQDAFAANDYAAAAQSTEHASELTSDMAGEISSPLWAVASFAPFYGSDISSMRSLVVALDDVFDDGLVPLMQTLEANPPETLISPDRRINVTAVTQLLDAVQGAAPSMQACADVLETMPEMHLDQLRSVVDPAKEKLIKINGVVQRAASLAPVAGPILGANGDRTYLLVAQNSAELRSSGGFPGSMGTLEIRGGEIVLNDFSGVINALPETNPASVTISDEEYALFGAYSMDTPWDTGIDPDFTRVASIWAASYEEKNAAHLDGVISITPSVVQDILAIVGPITLADGSVLDGSNATRVLQHDIYWNYLSATASSIGEGNQITDALFAQAARDTFDKLFSNLDSGTIIKFASCIAEDMKDRTVMFWLTNEGEQALLASLGCSGALNTDSSKPELGVFYSAWIGSKMGWYVDISNEILQSHKNADGSYTYKMKTTIADAITPEEIAAGGGYIVGDVAGYEYGVLYPTLFFYAPAGGSISELESNASAEFAVMQHNGLQVLRSWEPQLRPGEPIVCTYTVTTAPNVSEEMKIVCTPTLTEYRVG